MRVIRVAVYYFGAKFDITGGFDGMTNHVEPDAIRMGGQDVTDFFYSALNDDAKRCILAKVEKAAHRQVYEGR